MSTALEPSARQVMPGTRVRVLPHAELCPEGVEFDARPGRKLVDELLAHGVAIELPKFSRNHARER
jgi:hypothetical protein